MMVRLLLTLVVCASCSGVRAVPRSAPALPQPVVTSGEPSTAKLAVDLSLAAVALGAGPAANVASGQIAAGERLGAFVEIPSEACLLAYARGSHSLEDIDLVAFSDEGDPLASDEAPDPRPAVMLCPPHPARVYLAVHAASGEGLVSVVAHLVPVASATPLASAFHTRNGRGGVSPPDAWAGLDEAVARQRRQIGGTWEDARRVALALDARAPTVVGMPINAGQCVDAFIVTSGDVKALDVEVQGDGQVVIARASATRGEAAVVVCSESTVRASLVLRPEVGVGVAAVVFGQTSSASSGDFAESARFVGAAPGVSAQQSLERLEGALGRQGYAKAAALTSLSVASGTRATVAVNPGDACARVDVVAAAPLGAFHAALWTPSGTELSEASGLGHATLFDCGRSKAAVELEARGAGGSVSVTTRPEIWRDPLFVAHPLAASRMLTRAASGPLGVMEGAASGARFFSLDASRREAWELSLPAGACSFVYAGGEGEGAGVALEVIDAANAEVLGRSSSPRAASVRACAAAEAPRRLRVLVRPLAGKLEIVVGERVRAVTP